MIKEKFQKLSAIPTLHSENNRFSLCPDSYFVQGRFRNRTVPGRNSYSPEKVRIPTFSGTILELSRFLLCAEDTVIPLSIRTPIIFRHQ